VDILVQIAAEVYKSYVTTDKKGWNSYWYNARMLYMVQWLQAFFILTVINFHKVSSKLTLLFCWEILLHQNCTIKFHVQEVIYSHFELIIENKHFFSPTTCINFAVESLHLGIDNFIWYSWTGEPPDPPETVGVSICVLFMKVSCNDWCAWNSLLT
jgi:hypothetical protein